MTIDRKNPFGLHADDMTMAFIDGPSLYGTFKLFESENNFNYMALRDMLKKGCKLQDIRYYTVIKPDEDGYSPIKPVVDLIGNNGYTTIVKQGRTVSNDLGSKTKGSFVPQLTIDMYRAATKGMDHIILFSGDGDLADVIEAVKNEGCRVTVVSTRRERTVSDDLRWVAQDFVDLGECYEDFIYYQQKSAGRGGRGTLAPRFGS